MLQIQQNAGPAPNAQRGPANVHINVLNSDSGQPRVRSKQSIEPPLARRRMSRDEKSLSAAARRHRSLASRTSRRGATTTRVVVRPTEKSDLNVMDTDASKHLPHTGGVSTAHARHCTRGMPAAAPAIHQQAPPRQAERSHLELERPGVRVRTGGLVRRALQLPRNRNVSRTPCTHEHSAHAPRTARARARPAQAPTARARCAPAR
jgi:hypothetical protein